ncbi:MAG: DUF523 domain-containing protein [Myxococcota bacterium]|nr:DUF523 domain-containing protein [Myxococcota bacterium]
MRRHHARPRVLFSRCLALDPCRYDGDRVPDAFIGRLRAHVEAVDVCPEVAIGLGIPRPTIRLVGTPVNHRLIQPSTGRDLTGAMRAFTAQTIDALPPLDGAVLKSRSPSCGLGDTKVYDTAVAAEPVGLTHGVFAREIRGAARGLALADEARLGEPAVRRAFLERLFALAWLRDPTCTSPDLAGRLRHLLALDEDHHRPTLEIALGRAPDPSIGAAIARALTDGPSRDPDAPLLYPAALHPGPGSAPTER